MNLRDLLPLSRPLIGLDLETTGTDTRQARIVEIAFHEIKPDGTEREWSTLVNPGIPIPQEATAVHHINDTDVISKPTFAQIAPSLAKGFTEVDFYGFNVTFDLKVLLAEFARCSIAWEYGGARVVDGFRLWQLGAPRTLTDAVTVFGVPPHDAHTALDDIKATGQVIARQLERWPTVLPRELGRLHALQFPRDPAAIDPAGKFRWENGVPVINFGKHKGVSLQKVDRGYLQWMLHGDFESATRAVARDALNGVYPTK